MTQNVQKAPSNSEKTHHAPILSNLTEQELEKRKAKLKLQQQEILEKSRQDDWSR